MASLVSIAYKNGTFKYKKVDNHYELTSDIEVIEQYGDYCIKTKVKKGYKWDGASVPKYLQWFLPSFDKKNELYNVAALLHDVRYGARGFCLVSREETDDMLRGAWRISGISRIKAGIADVALEKIAESHWGNDNYHCSYLASMEMKKWNK